MGCHGGPQQTLGDSRAFASGVFWIFVDPAQLAGDRVQIAGPQGHHLARVLRVRAGERGVVVADGREYQVEVLDVIGGKVVARVYGDQPITGEPATSITLLQAVLPNPDFDAVIENGTAVGVVRFVAVQAERSMARPASARLARWRLIAASAAEQSHRGIVPEIAGPTTLTDALELVRGSRLLVLDPTAAQPLGGAIDTERSYALAVGPEGGWTEGELAIMTARGGTRVNLGPRILRARLAPIVATAMLLQQR
jgi:16S rRNA (uracil1498-N3)-methyltransferase